MKYQATIDFELEDGVNVLDLIADQRDRCSPPAPDWLHGSATRRQRDGDDLGLVLERLEQREDPAIEDIFCPD
jgi:hypothetical protein